METEQSEKSAALIEQAHLAMIRHQYTEVQNLLTAVLRDVPHNPDALAMASQLNAQTVGAQQMTPDLSNNPSFMSQYLDFSTWTVSNYFSMSFFLLFLALMFGFSPFMAGLDHGFGLTTLCTMYVGRRHYYSTPILVPIWPLLIFSGACLAASAFVLIMLVYNKVVRRGR